MFACKPLPIYKIICAQSLSHVRLFATPWAVTHQALYPWDFPGKNTGAGCHFLFQEIFPTEKPNLSLLLASLALAGGSLPLEPPEIISYREGGLEVQFYPYDPWDLMGPHICQIATKYSSMFMFSSSWSHIQVIFSDLPCGLIHSKLM